MQACCVVVLAVAIGSVCGCDHRSPPGTNGEPQPTTSAPAPAGSAPPGPVQIPPKTRGDVSFQNGFAPIVEAVSGAVVNVSSVRFVRPPVPEPLPFFSDPFFHEFFGQGEGEVPLPGPRVRREQSLGSGVVVSRDGYVLTNAHVIQNASQVRVAVPGKRELTAKVIGADPKTDVAVLKLEGDGFAFATFGRSEAVRVGELALAIGNPFGIGQTVTQGIISAVGRGNIGIVDFEDFLQTDAAINPGNSGGALIGMSGELIGINTAILSRGAQGNQGIGFAIPSELAREVMDQILRNGRVIRGALGVAIQDVTPVLAEALGLKPDTQGALVSDVSPGSPAEKAGLRRGDVIVALNGKPVVDGREFRMRIAESRPGTEVHLRVLHDGRERELTAVLGELPEPPQPPHAAPAPAPSSALGINAAPLSEDLRQKLKAPRDLRGVVVLGIDPEGSAAAAGLHPGDVILEVNRAPVDGPEPLKRQVERTGKHPLALLVWREGRSRYIVMERS